MSEPRLVTPAGVTEKLARREEIFLVDVRTPREYHKSHISDAILLPADDFADRYDRELDKDDAVILVCERGQTADAAARFLLAEGFTNVSVMVGGMSAWTGAVIAAPSR